jgi:hypothetical protein
VSDGKRVAVVRIDPVAEPPCVTTDGQLFERVSGETIAVREGADVRALYDRGRAAVERAEANALRALDEVATGSIPGGGPILITVLSVAPVGTARDIAAEVFSPRIVKRVRELVDALPTEPHFPEHGLQRERFTEAAGRQDAIVFETTPDLIQMWRLRTAWDGSVAGLLRASPGTDFDKQYILSDALFDEIIRPLTSAVEAAARSIGGYGRAHVAFRPIASNFGIRHGKPFSATHAIPFINEILPIQRWADSDPWLDDDLLESIKRELLRACGFLELEPDP